jgi:hypothetical protein
MADRDLRELERRTFRKATDDGLWDILISSFVAAFAIGPLLSETLGDLWSSAIFLPIWLALSLAARVVRSRILAPRLGTVRMGADRRRRMHRLGVALLCVNIVACAIGIAVAIGAQQGRIDLEGLGFPLMFSLVILAVFSFVAYAVSIPRYALYGLILAIAPLLGEWLWRHDLASHHGYPIVFGVAAAVIFTVGVARLAVLVRRHPLPPHSAAV